MHALKILLFVCVVVAPLAGLAVLGEVPSYGQSPHPAYPSVNAVLHAEQGALDALGAALLHRSPATTRAIGFKNWLAYDVVGFIDDRNVVSGRGDWLFYHPELEPCFDRRRASRSAAQIDAMTQVAGAAGLRMVVSMSPDKATIYPEQMHPLTERYWHCKASTSKALREALRQEAPELIDHTPTILAAKERSPQQQLYFHKDTHWTRYAGVLALRDTLAAVLHRSVAELPPPGTTAVMDEHTPDLSAAMLLLPGSERVAHVDGRIEATLPKVSASQKTVLLRDSFYGVVIDDLRRLFTGVKQFSSATAGMRQPLLTAKLLVVNFVERNFIARTAKAGPFSWTSHMGRGIARRNAAEATKVCGDYVDVRADGQVLKTKAITTTPEGFRVVGNDPHVVVPLPAARAPGERPCVRLALSAKTQTVEIEIFLPTGRSEDNSFALGRTFQTFVDPKTSSLAIILPTTMAGHSIRIDPGPDRLRSATISLIEVGAASTL